MIGDGDHPLQGKITNQEQATKLVEMYCNKATTARELCNVVIPGDTAATVRAQQRAHQQWLMQYGGAVGSLVALHRAGMISDNAYEQLQQKVFQTLKPSVVGDITPPITVVRG